MGSVQPERAMKQHEMDAADATSQIAPPAAAPGVPPQDGTLQQVCLEHAGSAELGSAASPGPGGGNGKPGDNGEQRSGVLYRPIPSVQRSAVRTHDAQTELEQYKAAMRKYAPVQKGVEGLPWAGTWHCLKCDSFVPGKLLYEKAEDAIYLEFDCPKCGTYRERHHDVLFVKQHAERTHPRQPTRTHSGTPIRPIVTGLPKTVETLCPECACLILGRCYAKDDIVWTEKTCPEHGHFRDKIFAGVKLYLQSTQHGFEDERGLLHPQVEHATACPTDCGLCNQHLSTTVLAQIDMTNRCNLTCPVCFANANAAGYVSEPSYEMVIEELQALRNLRPYPATAIQFTGGEPTLHPDFHRIVKKAGEMGFSHLQIATNGITHADWEFAQRSAEVGLHNLYLQFDGLDDEMYKVLRAQPLLEKKLAAIENCRKLGMKVCLVPTIVNNFNRDQVPKIFRFAVENADVIAAIAYQPVTFTGRISRHDLEHKRYTLGDLAQDIAACSGASLDRDFEPLNTAVPLSRMLQTLDGKPKIRASCHTECGFGSYFFVTPEHDAIPIPKVFNYLKLMNGFNEFADRIQRTRPDGLATKWDVLRLAFEFFRLYRWSEMDFRVTPFSFMRSIRGMVNKRYGRGSAGKSTVRTLMAAGMHFMDRYNFDTERVKRCCILYSTVDGVYPFCAINSGPTYRPFIEAMYKHGKRE
jgi:7,8-dihydro-6-hydroxymethylpterin dimethyltransferase